MSGSIFEQWGKSIKDGAAALRGKFNQFANANYAESLVIICALVSAADGTIQKEERVRTAQAFEGSELLADFDKAKLRKQYDEYCDELIRDNDMVKVELLGKLRKYLRGHDEIAIDCIKRGILIAKSAEGISTEEVDVINEICHECGVSPTEFTNLKVTSAA